MRKKLPSVLNVGLPSILTIFLILALVTFATLSLVTSRFAWQQARQNAQRSEAYGEACAQAEDLLVRIDQVLYESYRHLSVPEEETYLSEAYQALAGISELTVNRTDSGLLITYQIPVTGTQLLQAELLAEFPAEEGTHFYRILKWMTSPADAWNADETLPIYGNEE